MQAIRCKYTTFSQNITSFSKKILIFVLEKQTPGVSMKSEMKTTEKTVRV